MKYIPLAVVDQPGIEEKFSYRDRMLSICRASPVVLNDKGLPVQRGVDAAELIRRLEIIAVLKTYQDGDVLSLEKDDHRALVAYVNETRWEQATDIVLDFINAVRNAADTPPETP